MDFLVKLIWLLVIINKIYARSLNDSLLETEKFDLPKFTYLNLTVSYHPNDSYSLSYDLIPIDDTEFESQQRLLQDQVETLPQPNPQVDALNQELLFPTTTPGYLSAAIENILKVIPTIPNAAAETVGNLFGEIYGLIGINITQVRMMPLGIATQSINNIAYCNPLFAPVNPGRCKGYFMAT